MIIDETKLEAGIAALGTEIFKEVQSSPLSPLDPEFYTSKMMDWSMEDEDFKVSLFRFVDVLPSLGSSTAVVEHAQEYFRLLEDKLPGVLRWGLKTNPSGLPAHIGSRLVRRQVRGMAKRFIVGENPKSAMSRLERIREHRMAFTIDLLGEATLSETESIAYLNRYLDLVSELTKVVPTWSVRGPIVDGHRGEQNPINISVKLSALYSQVKPLSAEKSVAVLSERLGQIVSAVSKVQGFVYVDMEDSSLTDITIAVFKKVFGSPQFKSYDKCGLVLQAYLRRTEDDLHDLISWAKNRETPIAVRLVKGAYWDTESILCRQRGWPIPVWLQKASTDLNYEKLSLVLLQNSRHVLPAFASHNIRSLCHAITAASLLGVSNKEFELQALYGMAEPFKKAFVERGFLLREYAPIGDLILGMGYLVRRLLENTSNEGFLRHSFHENLSPKALLSKPVVDKSDDGTKYLPHDVRKGFFNEPFTDYSFPEFRAAQRTNLESLRAETATTPRKIAPIVSGKAIQTKTSLPSNVVESPETKLADVGICSPQDATRAVTELSEYFPVWRDTSVVDRAEILFRTAEVLTRRKQDLISIMMLEAGKQIAEADADVAEAIDFLNYYAHEAIQLFQTKRLGAEYPGELNTYFYEPRGVSVVISPWNFPLAIPCGMFAASLVTGNTTVLKPAEQTQWIASELFQAFLEAGLPPQAAAFLPGIGEEVGPVLVEHPDVATIVFTGSKDVGLQILNQAADTSPSAVHVKRVIVEMGGKNAIIVDSDADLDEAVKGVIYSAFGFQGQKCSACSRVFVVGDAYDKFCERIAEALKSIIVGPASDFSTLVGPVIDNQAADRIRSTIERGKADCKVLAEGLDSPLTSYVRPIIFRDVPETHELLQKEIFGPVLAVAQAPNFSESIAMALRSEYALTGAVFSRNPAHIDEARANFRVGNLYINRGSTGALVMRHPFGGFRMSGVGSKAGGPDYLQQFVIPRAISENTIRRGFAPE